MMTYLLFLVFQYIFTTPMLIVFLCVYSQRKKDSLAFVMAVPFVWNVLPHGLCVAVSSSFQISMEIST